MSNEDERKRGIRILVLEGAGAKGLSQLLTLKEIMYRIQNAEGLDELPDPYEWLEFVIGVDTAALIVALLGRLRMPIDKVIECFKKLGEDVYSNKKGISKSAGSTEYKTTKLKQTLRQIIRDVTGNENEMMEADSNLECKTAIFAMSKHNMNAGMPTIFRSYRVCANQTRDCAIWEAVGASMAHPAHFKSIDVGEPPARESFVTGSLGCSNPTAHALEEVKRVYPDRHVSCIIVIGAGHARTIHIPEPSPMQRVLVPTDPNMVAMSIAMDPERVAEEMAGRFRGTTNVYFRLSVGQGMQAVGSDSWDELGKIMAHTRQHMWQGGVSADIDKIVTVMRERKLAVSTVQIDGQIQLPIQQIAAVNNCPDPTPVFTGRDDMIQRITKCIIDGDKQRCVFVLHGLGGAGKTQIALKTVQTTRDMWTDIVYVDATTWDTSVTGLTEFAKLKKIGDAHTDTIQWLSIRRERWLMVFDNADNPGLDVRNFFPPGNHGSILITTRISQLSLIAQGADPECSVFSMYSGEALELLLKTAGLNGGQMSEADHSIVVKLLQ
ncbi:hypothetical protein FRC06_001139 [Ceratobasidium sp. 370]|nr:hypothetical protein FRC06_001139 [Ceratobasidium sp. 370]